MNTQPVPPSSRPLELERHQKGNEMSTAVTGLHELRRRVATRLREVLNMARSLARSRLLAAGRAYLARLSLLIAAGTITL